MPSAHSLLRLQVRYLKVIEKSGYQALPWVRYITTAGEYEIRCVSLFLVPSNSCWILGRFDGSSSPCLGSSNALVCLETLMRSALVDAGQCCLTQDAMTTVDARSLDQVAFLEDG